MEPASHSVKIIIFLRESVVINCKMKNGEVTYLITLKLVLNLGGNTSLFKLLPNIV